MDPAPTFWDMPVGEMIPPRVSHTKHGNTTRSISGGTGRARLPTHQNATTDLTPTSLEETRLNLLRGFVMLGLALPAFAQYAGPAILSRGEAPAGMSRAADGFIFSLTFASEYTNGVEGISAQTAQGQPANQPAFGGIVTLGATGGHTWEHTHLGLNYSGSFRDFSQSTSSGLSQGLSFDLSHMFSPHTALSVRESAGMFSNFLPGTVSLNSSVPLDPSQSYLPATNFYNNRTIFSSTQANLVVQESAGLSFSLGGGYFINQQQSSALYGAQGETATGDVQYRL